MTPQQYADKAITLIRGHWGKEPDVMHGFLGIASESGELLSLAKKMYVKDKLPDRDDVVDELGDLLWYIHVVMACYDITFDEATNKNIIKLEYRDKFGKNKPVERELQLAAGMQ
jgi:NTP pyrophosphatase (non-canonical NTP hydrolase)